MTIWSAYQHFEEASKGSIEVGKLADFVVLSENPLEVEPQTLHSLTVLETIKGGESIYRRSEDGAAAVQAPPLGVSMAQGAMAGKSCPLRCRWLLRPGPGAHLPCA